MEFCCESLESNTRGSLSVKFHVFFVLLGWGRVTGSAEGLERRRARGHVWCWMSLFGWYSHVLQASMVRFIPPPDSISTSARIHGKAAPGRILPVTQESSFDRSPHAALSPKSRHK